MKTEPTTAEKLKAARHILSLYDSPFPDAQEREIRTKQETYIRELEDQIQLEGTLAKGPKK